MAEKSKHQQHETTWGELKELVRQGCQEAIPKLREILDKHPELWRTQGNLACHAQNQWLELIAGQDVYLKEVVARFAADLRAELAGSEASPLETLIIERIVALSIQINYYELILARVENLKPTETSEYLHKRCQVADNRLQQAIVQLARIQKLLPNTRPVEVILSGEVQAKLRRNDDSGETSKQSPKRMRVPENRIKDLLAAAKN